MRHLQKLKSIIKKIFDTNNKFKKTSHRKYSFSQCGEDLIVKYIFSLRDIPHPSYIDIGAYDPYILSNTALFYENGSRGINIEANPYLIKNFLKYRPDDINLNYGIGRKDEIINFHIMNDPTLSTFSESEYQTFMKTGRYRLKELRKVQVTTINNILDQYFNGQFPDFLSLDAEGMDYDILKSIKFEISAPKVICVEASEYSPIGAGKRRNELIDFLGSKEYFEYANTNLNAIMVRKDLWYI